MKLTCVLIIAVLFLTACQLATAKTYSTGRQKHRALRSTDKNIKLSRRCNDPGGSCTRHYHCCQLYCNKQESVCLENEPAF
uniref:Conotoxin Bt6.5 n=2 Tax=Conus betulinus TaxID=89764 RepID=O165_CONBE|nr:RecName: Full=Conotoxin Bt6.5; AltName: Full=Conotoxin BeB42; Flags: Precursor [Conus betulinus]AAZ83782.1 BeB42P [Conus betulinus]AMP44714.1 conotoxin [Conus betulinus]